MIVSLFDAAPRRCQSYHESAGPGRRSGLDVRIAALEASRAPGVAVSIDRFGTGRSSLGSIRVLPATEAGIDRSLVADIGFSPRNAIIGHPQRAAVIAELVRCGSRALPAPSA